MTLIDTLVGGINLMLHPGANSSKKMDIGSAFMYYYKMAIVPLVLAIIISALGIGAASLFAKWIPWLTYLGVLGYAIISIMTLLIFIPISIFIDAGIIHAFGKLIRQFRFSFTNTLTAVVYSMVPTVLLFWLEIIPVAGTVVGIIAGIWGFVILVIALSRQQKISAFASFGVLILLAIVIFFIVFAVLLLLTASIVGISSLLNSSLANSTVAQGAFSQQNPVVTSVNYSSCGSFVLSTPKQSSTVKGICSWSGGSLEISVGGGLSGYEAMTIAGADGKTYVAQHSTEWQLAPYETVYLPAQNYTISLSTGAGGGSNGNAVVEMKKV